MHGRVSATFLGPFMSETRTRCLRSSWSSCPRTPAPCTYLCQQRDKKSTSWDVWSIAQYSHARCLVQCTEVIRELEGCIRPRSMRHSSRTPHQRCRRMPRTGRGRTLRPCWGPHRCPSAGNCPFLRVLIRQLMLTARSDSSRPGWARIMLMLPCRPSRGRRERSNAEAVFPAAACSMAEY